MNLFRRLHTTVYAYFIKWHRTRKILQTFVSAHSEELRRTSISDYPLVLARQSAEISAIKAGKLDTVAERKSWQWPWLPASIQRLSVPILKPIPYNLRRMSRTPVPRRAINLIKGALISQPWDVRPIEGMDPIDSEDEQKERIRIAKGVFSHPNNQDSFQSMLESGLEDMCTVGALVCELGLTPDTNRPLKIWPVNCESIRIFPAWTESTPDNPHYAQMTGLKGERGAIVFYDDELLYIRDNPSTDNPFGLGKMEVAFASISSFLGVQDMAGKAGADQVHKTFLWWNAPQSESHIQIVRRHIQNELEGQAKLSIIAGMQKPETVEVTPVTENDLLLNWQELLIRMIANAFDMSAMALGIERDVNRATGEVLDDKDFRSAVVPMAKRFQEGLTRKALHGKLRWYDLEFVFLNLDDPDSQTKMTLYTQMYSTNSITSNEIRKGMGKQPMVSPLGDLTQFELMLLSAEMAAKLKDNSAQKAADQQQQMQQPGMDPFAPDGEDGAPPDGQNGFPPKQNGFPGSSGGGAGSVPKISAPPKLSLPKFPIAGSRYNAKQIAMMPVNKAVDVFKATGMPMHMFLQALENQEPGILQTLTDEVKEFFKRQLEEEKKPKKKLPPKTLARWQKELEVEVGKMNKRASDMSTWLYENRGFIGKPGGGNLGPSGKGPK